MSGPAAIAYSSETVQPPERNYARSVRIERMVFTSNGGLADEAHKYSILVKGFRDPTSLAIYYLWSSILRSVLPLSQGPSYHTVGMQHCAPAGRQAG